MIIGLTLNEMFAISRIVDKQTIIGYRAALAKLFHKMLDVAEFSKLVALSEEIKINEEKVLQEFESQRVEISQKVQKNQEDGNKELSEELQAECNVINSAVMKKIQEYNTDIVGQVNDLLKDKTISEFEFNELLMKSISNIVESEKTSKELGLDSAIIKYVIEVYLRFEK